MLLGSSGLLGTAIETICKQRNIQCAGLTHTDLEITHKEEVEDAIRKFTPGVVINATGLVGVRACEAEPEKAFSVNTIAVSNLAKICEGAHIVLVQPSTHTVFDGTKDDYYTEEDQPNPLQIYGASKYAAECLVRNICRKNYIIRLPTFYGRRRNKSLGFIDKVLAWIDEGEILRVADDKVDSPTYNLDIASAVITLLKDSWSYGVYHIANSGTTTLYDFVLEIVKLLGSDTKVARAKDSDFWFTAPNAVKTAMKSVKLPPPRSWQEALCEYIEGLKAK